MGRLIPLTKPTTAIGRGPDNDMILAYDRQVSRRHAEFRRSGPVVTLVDLDSQNGTQVNGQKIQQHILQVGDQIRLGEATLTYQDGAVWAPDEVTTSAGTGASSRNALPWLLGGLAALALLLVLVGVLWPRRSAPPLAGVVAVGGPAGSTSGVIVDARGLILTTHHQLTGSVAPSVGVTSRPEVPPATWFASRVVAADPDLDLAVLALTGQLSGEPLKGPLDLPALTLGNSDLVGQGERLRAVGYYTASLAPVFGEIPRVQDTAVARFAVWPGGTRQWIETDRDLANLGYAGGAILNERNELVGLAQPIATNMRQVRPINLVQTLVRQARVALGW